MSITTHNSEELKELFNSLPVVDESRPDLRVINFDILNSVVGQASAKAALHASMDSFKEAKDIVHEVLSKSSISL